MADPVEDFGPFNAITRRERDMAEVAADEAIANRELRSEDLFDAIRDEWIGGQYMLGDGTQRFEPVPGYQIGEEKFSALTQNVPLDHQDIFKEATSDAHADYILQQYNERVAREKSLEELGWTGLGVRVGAALLDPVAIGVDIASFGAMTGPIVAAKATRLRAMVRAGLAAGTSNAAIEAALAANDPLRDTSDVLLAAAAGMTIGGSLGAIAPRAIGGVSKKLGPTKGAAVAKEAEEILALPSPEMIAETEAKLGTQLTKQLEADEAKEAGLELTPKGQQEVEAFKPKTVEEAFPDVEPEVKEVAKAIREEAPVPPKAPEGEDLSQRAAFANANRILGDPGAVPKSEILDTLRGLGVEADKGTKRGDLLDMLTDAVAKGEPEPKKLIEQDLFADSTGAAGSPFRVKPISETASDAVFEEGLNEPVGQFTKFRFDITGRLLGSKNPLVKRLGVTLAEDAVGLKGMATPIGASEEAMRTWRVVNTEYAASANANFRKWLDDYEGLTIGKGRLANAGKWKEFNYQVTQAVRRLNNAAALAEYHPAVVDAARTMSRVQNDLLNAAKRAGVTGFEDVADNAAYVTRLASRDALERALNRYGSGQVTRMIANAIIQGSEAITPESAERVAKKWIQTHREIRVGANAANATVRGAQDLRTMLIDTLVHEKGIDPQRAADEVDAMVQFRKDKGDGSPTRAKRRVQFDETYSERLTAQGGAQEMFKLEDLFENDAQYLLSLYSRQIGGFIALAKRGIPDEGAFRSLLDKARKADPEYRPDPRKLEDEIKALQTVFNHIVGRPLHDYGTGTTRGNINRTMRRLMDLQFVRVMNQVGFAQIPEMGVLMGQVGIRTVMQQVPAFKSFVFRSLRTGKIEDELQQELEAIWAYGTDNVRAHFGQRIDDFGEFDSTGRSAIDETLDKGKFITTHISGFNLVNQISQRWANRAIVSKFAEAAFSRAKIAPKRLQSLGIEQDMADRIYAQIREHALTGEAFLTGRKMKRINLDAWTDREAADTFVNSVDRWVRRAIQHNDIGNLGIWLTNPTVQMLTQFRTFMLVAYPKQFLHGMAHLDSNTVMGFLYSMMLAGASYVGQQTLNAQGRKDKDKFLKERLSPENIAASAWQRAGWATFFPSVYDSTVQFSGIADPVFRYGRTTGLPSDVLLGNPTTSFVDTLLQTTSALGQAATGKSSFTQSELSKMTSLLPFSNALIVKNGLKRLSQDSGLPQRDLLRN